MSDNSESSCAVVEIKTRRSAGHKGLVGRVIRRVGQLTTDGIDGERGHIYYEVEIPIKADPLGHTEKILMRKRDLKLVSGELPKKVVPEDFQKKMTLDPIGFKIEGYELINRDDNNTYELWKKPKNKGFCIDKIPGHKTIRHIRTKNEDEADDIFWDFIATKNR